MRIAAIIPAAGQGKRMGRTIAKQYLKLGNKPVLWHTLNKIVNSGIFAEIVLVVSRKDKAYSQELLNKYKFGKVRIMLGGRERQDSVYSGLKSLRPCDYVAIHDGVRCLVTTQLIKGTVQAARRYGAAIAAVPLKDTVKEAGRDQMVKKTVDRDKLWLVQTPQVFQYRLIMKAHEKAKKSGYYGTDDAILVEKLGRKVKLVLGSYNNIKITTAIDLSIAADIIKKGLE